MHRHSSRIPVRVLLTASLLLVACHGVEAVDTGSEEPLGTGESAMCSGVSVTTLAISGASTYQKEMAASGSWGVTGGANAVRLEYYIDNKLYSSEERTGASGTWYFSQTGVYCGTRTLMVKAWPMVIDSAGNRTTCWGATKTASQSVTETCKFNYVTTESCLNMFMRTCYEANPTPACPYSPQGKTCPSAGWMCWLVKSADVVDIYVCQ